MAAIFDFRWGKTSLNFVEGHERNISYHANNSINHVASDMKWILAKQNA
jgi:hypothetical protein